MWLTNSSIGRKFVMALTGCCLVLFVTFHVLMNAVAIFWPTAYNAICGFLGANWYALIASAGLAALFIIHIVYALWLTIQNRRARGNDRYNVTTIPPHVEWSSQNMLVLGIVVVAFLAVHMIQFWAKMQLVEALHTPLADLPQVAGVAAAPEFGTLFLQAAFEQVWTPIVYIIGFVALWFHLNHGFWSMLHTIGWNNNIWMERLRKIGLWWSSIVVALFVIQAVTFYAKANSADNNYLQDPALQEQYAEFWAEQAETIVPQFQSELTEYMASVDQTSQVATQQAQVTFIQEKLPTIVERAQYIIAGFDAQCSKVGDNEAINGIKQFVAQMQYYMMSVVPQVQQPDAVAPEQPAEQPEEQPAPEQETVNQ